MKLKKGDRVKVIRGKDKGRTGNVEKVIGETKVLIANINQYKRHLKKRLANEKSEIVTITKPLSLHNVCLVCSRCEKKTRVGFKMKDGKKERFCKKCEEAI